MSRSGWISDGHVRQRNSIQEQWSAELYLIAP